MTLTLQRNPIWIAVLLSLGIHLLVVMSTPAWLPAFRSHPTPSIPAEEILKVRFPEMNRAETDGQLVDVIDRKPSEAAPPSDARFLSDKNRTVAKETQARITGPNPNASVGVRESSGSASPSASAISRQKVAEKGKYILDLPKSFLEQSGGRPNVAAIAPNNYLPQIEMGDETLLNTREYAYATYFIRMKRQMEAIWNPRNIIDRYRLDQPQYVTTVGIILNKKGEVSRVTVVRPSGNPALDQSAVAAVQQGGPYLNPPNALIERDGNIRIPSWNFIVTLGNIY